MGLVLATTVNIFPPTSWMNFVVVVSVLKYKILHMHVVLIICSRDNALKLSGPHLSPSRKRNLRNTSLPVHSMLLPQDSTIALSIIASGVENIAVCNLVVIYLQARQYERHHHV